MTEYQTITFSCCTYILQRICDSIIYGWLLTNWLLYFEISCISTIIDNIFSNITDFETKGGNILCEISDHCPQFIILDKVIPDYKSCSFAKRDYSNFDETKFIEDFSAMDLDILHDSNAPVNETFDCFYDKLSNLVDTHVPSKRMTPKEIKVCLYELTVQFYWVRTGMAEWSSG